MSTTSGARCVTAAGTTVKHGWCAGSWGSATAVSWGPECWGFEIMIWGRGREIDMGTSAPCTCVPPIHVTDVYISCYICVHIICYRCVYNRCVYIIMLQMCVYHVTDVQMCTYVCVMHMYHVTDCAHIMTACYRCIHATTMYVHITCTMLLIQCIVLTCSFGHIKDVHIDMCITHTHTHTCMYCTSAT